MAELFNCAFGPKANATAILQLRDIDISVPYSGMSPLELIRICSRNRPAGISDSNWETFLLSLSFDCFDINFQSKLDREVPMEATSTISLLGSSRSSVNAVIEISVNEDFQSWTSSADATTGEFAARLELPLEDSDNYDAKSISLGDVQIPSTPNSISSWSSATCIGGLVGGHIPKLKCDLRSNLRYTTLTLGDLPCNLYEEVLLNSESKISTAPSSTKTK